MVVDQRDDGVADVAADHGGEAGLLEDFADERSGGGLAVGAGDGEDLAFEEAGRQFEFADDGAAEVAGLHSSGVSSGTPGLTTMRSWRRKVSRPWPPASTLMPSSSKAGNVFGKRFGAADVGDGDLGSLAAQEHGRGQAGFAESDDQNFFAFELHMGRSVLTGASAFSLDARF